MCWVTSRNMGCVCPKGEQIRALLVPCDEHVAHSVLIKSRILFSLCLHQALIVPSLQWSLLSVEFSGLGCYLV